MSRTKQSITKTKKQKFNINDHSDILIEILKHLDLRSLGIAACVCRQWCSITRKDTFWEHLCFHHVSPSPPLPSGMKTVVVALGGYKRLYMICLQPALSRLGSGCERLGDGGGGVVGRRLWGRLLAQVSLSLFSVDYYERLGMGEGSGGRGGGVGGGRVRSDAVASSLAFLCNCVSP